MNKRGETMLFAVIEILAAVFIVYSFTSAANAFATQDIYEKSSLAKDIALQIGALNAIPGNAYLTNSNPKNYSYYFSKNKIIVAEKTAQEPFTGVGYYSIGKDDKIDLILKKPKALYLSNIGREINAGDKEPNLLQISCPVVETKDREWRDKLIYVDYDDSKEENKRIADAFGDNLGFIGFQNVGLMTGSDSEKETMLQSANKDYVYLAVNFGESTKDNNNIKAYIPLDSPEEIKIKSYKLACMMLNSILSRDDLRDINITGAAVIPTNDDDLLNEAKQKVAVSLSIGNLNHEDGQKLKMNYASVALAIKDAVTQYYIEDDAE